MTGAQQKAAEMLARGASIPKVAKAANVTERTVYNWKADKTFSAEITRIEREWRVRARGKGASDQDTRLHNLDNRYRRLIGVIHSRAKDPAMKDVPGGRTGLLCVTYKMQSLGADVGSQPVAEYAVDTGMLAEMRAIEQHVAVELGQWKPKSQVETLTSQTATIIEQLHAGRKRAADEKAKRDANAAKSGPERTA